MAKAKLFKRAVALDRLASRKDTDSLAEAADAEVSRASDAEGESGYDMAESELSCFEAGILLYIKAKGAQIWAVDFDEDEHGRCGTLFFIGDLKSVKNKIEACYETVNEGEYDS
jgi:hypothetical protein